MTNVCRFSTGQNISALITPEKSAHGRLPCDATKQRTGFPRIAIRLAHQGGNAMSRRKLTRRQFVAATAATSAALITAPYVRGAYAAGKVSIGFWDHWVPGANSASTELCKEWGEKEKVDVEIDYITSQNNKNQKTNTTKTQTQTNHNNNQKPTWWCHSNSELMEPLND